MKYWLALLLALVTTAASAQSIAFLQQTPLTTDTDVYTFTDENIGTAASDRQIIVCVASRDTAAIDVSTVTVGGESATVVVEHNVQTGGAYSYCGIWRAAVPTGTTGTVVVTFTGAQVRCIIDSYRATGMNTTPVDTDFDDASPDPSKTLTTGAGFAIASIIYPATSSVSWTNLTERSESVTETNTLVSSASDETTAGTLAITANVVGSAANSIGVFATWEYDGGSAVPVIFHNSQLHR